MELAPDLTFTLHGPVPANAVSVRLRRFGRRWVAVSDPPGRSVGVGATARAALTAAIAPLGPVATREMLADLSLLGPSLVVLQSERGTAVGA
jgi:hypothetical protein